MYCTNEMYSPSTPWCWYSDTCTLNKRCHDLFCFKLCWTIKGKAPSVFDFQNPVKSFLFIKLKAGSCCTDMSLFCYWILYLSFMSHLDHHWNDHLLVSRGPVIKTWCARHPYKGEPLQRQTSQVPPSQSHPSQLSSWLFLSEFEFVFFCLACICPSQQILPTPAVIFAFVFLLFTFSCSGLCLSLFVSKHLYLYCIFSCI